MRTEIHLCAPERTAIGTLARQEQDDWPLRTQQRFGAAQAAGKFAAEIVPVDVRVKGKIEAFAAVAIACMRELGLPADIVNIEGGAIAHGHPIGATGAILATRLLHSMRRDRLKRGLVTLFIGGGQAVALAVETVT